jgi:hypothetical protein
MMLEIDSRNRRPAALGIFEKSSAAISINKQNQLISSYTFWAACKSHPNCQEKGM